MFKVNFGVKSANRANFLTVTVVAAREGDLETECVWPELSGLLKFHKFAVSMMNAAEGTPNGGRQLLSWALKAGVEGGQITVSYSTWSYSTLGDKEIWGRSPLR